MVVVLHKGAYKKQSRASLTDQQEVNRTKTRKNMFFNWPHCGKK